MYRIGVDIGYSTFKYIIVDHKEQEIGSEYLFHRGNILAAFSNMLKKIENEYKIKEFYFGITGDQAEGLPNLKKYYLNEVTALIEGAFASNSSLQSIIELGAQKAKFITNISSQDRTHMKFSMNSSCSAGTGSFLEEQVSRLGISLYEYSNYTEKATTIPRIAGRCSVFSKTDMIHHQQEGVKTEDILLGLAYALVRNFKGNVVQKNPVTPPVMLTGGVVHNKGVIKALKEIFQLEDKDILIPKHFDQISTLGATLLAAEKQQVISLEELRDAMGSSHKNNVLNDGYPTLYQFGQDESINKHNCKSVSKVCEGYLGIDIGSTSTNLVVIDDEKKVIAFRYLRTRGNPRQVVQEGIDSLQEEFDHRLRIKGMGTTGSGRYLIGKELGADVIVDEITAQAKGAVEADPEVDTVLEIGGQDSKYIRIEKGMVVDFEMNKICAAGTGSFIEEQAKKLDIPIEEFSQLALKSEKPLNLGDRCTVFIEGNIAKSLASNESKEDIAAGLAYSIVSNYLNRVVFNRKMGDKIFLQGGIAYNQAVINAFRGVLKKDIIVPNFFSVTGALGTALLVQEKLGQGAKHIDKEVDTRIQRNIEQEMETLFLKGYTGNIDKEKLTIGIPRVLFLHKLFTMFHEVFKTLGFNVILSKATDEEIVALSQEHSLEETCYPIKLINGHVASLINQGVDYIFLPSLYTMKHDVSKTREDYSCVYMQTVSNIVSHVMDLDKKGVNLLSPALSFKFGKAYMLKTLLSMGKELGKNKAQMAFAIMKGMARLQEYSRDVDALSQELVQSLQNEEKAFVIMTRTYNVADPILNMKIPQKLREMGYKVLTLANIPAFDYDVSEDHPNMYWPFGQHILAGAKIVRDMPNLYPIYITNHGCGPDTVLSHYFDIEMQGKPYLHIEVDEHSSSVGVITRLEAFVNSLDNYNGKARQIQNVIAHTPESREGTVQGKLLLPNIYPYSQVLCEWFDSKGIATEILPESTHKSLEIGRKFTKSKEYLSMFSLLGDIFYYLKNTGEKKVKLWLPQSEGSEVYGQYGKMVSEKLKGAGYQEEVISPFIEDLLEDKDYGFDFTLGVIVADLVMTAAPEDRDTVLMKGLDLIKKGELTKEKLIELSKYIYSQLTKRTYDKQIYVLGEFSTVFNPYLNNFQLENLEKKHRIMYQPLSELLLFLWHDYLNKAPKNRKKFKDNLEKVKDVITDVGDILSEYSSFDEDFNKLLKEADKRLPLYAGGAGRYRLAKVFRSPDHVQGILTISSMYENTATIQRILRDRDKEELKHPLLDLFFDGSNHSNNKESLETFIHYI